MLDFDDDLKEMLSSDEHGVTFFLSGIKLEGIINNEFLSQEIGRVGYESTTPMLYASSVEIRNAKHGDAIKITKGKHKGNYKIKGVQPDGTGLSLLVLEND